MTNITIVKNNIKKKYTVSYFSLLTNYINIGLPGGTKRIDLSPEDKVYKGKILLKRF